MPGSVLAVAAAVGDRVTAGDTLVVVESMKMEITMVAPFDGVVAEVDVASGDRVGVDRQLIRVEPA